MLLSLRIVCSLIILSFINFSQAVEKLKFNKWSRYSKGDLTTLGCDWAIAQYITFCNDTETSANCMCVNEACKATYLHCIDTNSETEIIKTGAYKYFISHFCTSLDMEELLVSLKNGSQYLQNEIPTSMSEIQYTPVLTNHTIVENAIETFRIRYGVFDYGMYFGMGLSGYIALVLLFAGFNNLLKVTRLNHIIYSWKIYKIVFRNAMLLNMKRKYYYISYDNIVILFWCIFNVLSLCVNYESNGTKNVYWNSSYKQITRYISDRAGYIAMFLTNLTWFMGQRNNLLSLFTGWPQAKFLLYHKWIGRACALHVIVHSIFLLWQSTVMGYQSIRVSTYWYEWGCVATISIAIQVVWACWFIKNLAYETFLVAHIIMALFFLIGSWYHLASKQRAHWFIYPICCWGLERLTRIWKIWLCGGVHKNAIIRLEPVSDIISIKVDSSFTDKFKLAGQFAYLYLLDLDSDWVFMFQSHPFTFVFQDDGSVMFYCKVKRGVTKKFKNLLLGEPNFTKNISILIEGPYGGVSEIDISGKNTENLLMVSSSTGVSGALCHLKMAIRNKVKNITMIWVVPNTELVKFMKSEFGFLFNEKLNDINLSIKIHITREMYEHEYRIEKFANFKNIEVIYGRPDINAETVAFLDAADPNKITNVLLCSHKNIILEAKEIVDLKKSKGQQITFYDETQTW
ncbi:hypothetical protein QEN19_001633 [Hanseniaspora menglaensis]